MISCLDDRIHDVIIFEQSQYRRSTLDNPIAPVRGNRLALSAIYVGGRDKRRDEEWRYISSRRDWWGVKASWEHLLPISSRWFSFGYSLEGVYTNHPQFEDLHATSASMPHYAPTTHSKMIYMPEYHAARYAAAGVMPVFRVIDNLYLRAGFYAMYRQPMASVATWQYIADFSISYNSIVGPVSLTLTKYDISSPNNLYLTFNFGYLLFAPKGTFY